MFDDEKIKLIEQMPEADTILIIWVKLLSQAGKTNASGYIYLSENIPYTDEMLSAIFNRPLNTIRLALETLEQFGMIEIDSQSFIRINNWEKHQNIEGMERIRLQNRERKRKQRAREKAQLESKKVTSRDSHATEVEAEEELEVERDKEVAVKENQEENAAASKNQYIKNLLEKYLNLKQAIQWTPNDELAAMEIYQSGVSLQDAIQYLDEKFSSFEKNKKHSRDRINSLSYCVGYILDKKAKAESDNSSINENKSILNNILREEESNGVATGSGNT